MVVSAKKENKSVERDSIEARNPGAWDAPGTGWAHWLDKKNRGVAGG